MNLCVP